MNSIHMTPMDSGLQTAALWVFIGCAVFAAVCVLLLVIEIRNSLKRK